MPWSFTDSLISEIFLLRSMFHLHASARKLEEIQRISSRLTPYFIKAKRCQWQNLKFPRHLCHALPTGELPVTSCPLNGLGFAHHQYPLGLVGLKWMDDLFRSSGPSPTSGYLSDLPF